MDERNRVTRVDRVAATQILSIDYVAVTYRLRLTKSRNSIFQCLYKFASVWKLGDSKKFQRGLLNCFFEFVHNSLKMLQFSILRAGGDVFAFSGRHGRTHHRGRHRGGRAGANPRPSKRRAARENPPERYEPPAASPS